MKEKNEICYFQNPNGPRLSWSKNSGMDLIEKDGLKFKDLAHDGTLYPYEDWRLPVEDRAKDLAGKLSIDQIAGLMLYSRHQFVPGMSNAYFGQVTYDGKELPESTAPFFALSDQQKEFMTNDYLRHVLVVNVSSPADAAMWNNNLQELAEKEPWGIPVSISSDPRHGTTVTFEFDAGAGGDISHWPEQLGLAATFDPELVQRFGKIAAEEYRAMGISTALSPQADLTTEPRWSRFAGSFTESPKLSTDLVRAYCDGFQTSEGEREISDGWGYDSVNAMVKHWPGGGPVEGGRDAHFGCGKYSVYPGNNFEEHLEPFVNGAFNLHGKTSSATAVMPYYTIAHDHAGEEVGCSYSHYLVQELLRDKFGFQGVVCTDWNITYDETTVDDLYTGKCWGVESLTQAERCYKIIMAGVDQFGGLNEKEPVLEAYEMGVKEHGEEFMRARFEESAYRLLLNIFRVGLFEDPYVDPERASKIVGCPEYMEEGFMAQVKSIVMLKNKDNVLPLQKKAKVYVPKIHVPENIDWMGNHISDHWTEPVPDAILDRYFTKVDTPEEADAALCFIRQPNGAAFSMLGGYDVEDRKNGGNGYVPVSLQYRPYTATEAREMSVAGGDPTEDTWNRSYKDKTVTVNNEEDLDLVIDTQKAMGDKPVIVCIKTTCPMVMSEVEPFADGILMEFGDHPQAMLEILCGMHEPSGLLPLQLPANMDTVEKQCEDVPFDMECHRDEMGNLYDFGYGMNWNGVIKDERVEKYSNQQ